MILGKYIKEKRTYMRPTVVNARAEYLPHQESPWYFYSQVTLEKHMVTLINFGQGQGNGSPLNCIRQICGYLVSVPFDWSETRRTCKPDME